MPVSVMMDIAIVAVFLLFTLLGWKRGLFRSLAELAAMALALLLGRYQAGNICTLTTYDLDGEELASLPLTEEVLDISAAGGYLAVLYGNSVVVYNKDLTEHARMEGTDYAGQVEMEDDGTVLLIAGASAWRFLP